MVFNFFLSSLQELPRLKWHVDVAINDFNTTWEGGISYNVVLRWCMIMQLEVDRLCHLGIMSTAKCIKMGCNDETYLERSVGLSAD